MRYERRSIRSQSFGMGKENKQNADTINMVNYKPKLDNHQPLKLQKNISQTTNNTLPKILQFHDVKMVYSQMIIHSYSQDIFSHYLSKLQNYQSFLTSHSITPTLRSKMVDWMIEVLSSYKMSQKTFFRSISIMDLYLKYTSIKQQLSNLHLIGVTSMFIAAKYQEIQPFKLDVIYDKIARKKFSKYDILQKQLQILSTLNFEMQRVTLYDVTFECLNQMGFNLAQPSLKYLNQIALYLSKMSLFSNEIRQLSDNVIAGAVIFISLKTLQQTDKYVQPQEFLPQIGQFYKIDADTLIEVSRKVLNLAKNFGRQYPNLNNLKRFNKFQYKAE